MIYEARHLYGESDQVARTVLTVEHHPGQGDAIRSFLANVCTQAGVYSVQMDYTECAASTPVETPLPSLRQASAPDAATITGEAHGEPKVQPEHLEPEAAADRERREAEWSWPATVRDARADGELAGASGAGAEAGPESGNP